MRRAVASLGSVAAALHPTPAAGHRPPLPDGRAQGWSGPGVTASDRPRSPRSRSGRESPAESQNPPQMRVPSAQDAEWSSPPSTPPTSPLPESGSSGTKTRFVGVRSNRTTDPGWAHTLAGWVGSTLEGKESLCHNASVNGVAPPKPPPLPYMQVSRRSDNRSGHVCEPERSVAISVSPRICRRSSFG